MSYQYKLILTKQIFRTTSLLNVSKFLSPKIVSRGHSFTLPNTSIFPSSKIQKNICCYYSSLARFRRVANGMLNFVTMH